MYAKDVGIGAMARSWDGGGVSSYRRLVMRKARGMIASAAMADLRLRRETESERRQEEDLRRNLFRGVRIVKVLMVACARRDCVRVSYRFQQP